MPYGLHDAQPAKNNKKFATVAKAKIIIKSPLNPPIEPSTVRTLAPSIGRKHNAKIIIVNATRGANLKIVFLASLGVISSFVKSLMKSAKG